MEEISINEPFQDNKKIAEEFKILINKEKIQLQVPDIVKELVYILKNFRYNFLSENSILSTVLVMLSHAIASKRIKYKEFQSFGYPNYYLIEFLPSGYGKDRIINDIKKYVLKYFYNWFNYKAEGYINKKKEEIRKKSFEKYPDSKQ